MRRTPLSRKTPMPRGDAGLARRTPPQQTAGLRRDTPLKAQSAKRRRQMRERRAMVAALWPDGRPVCAVAWCTSLADDVHEPLTRARGGSITSPDNAVPLCRPCHTVISDEQPDWAYEQGLLVHSWDRKAAS